MKRNFSFETNDVEKYLGTQNYGITESCMIGQTDMEFHKNRGVIHVGFLGAYSCVPIKQAGSIKGAGRKFHKIYLNKQAVTSKQGGNSLKNIHKMSRLY